MKSYIAFPIASKGSLIKANESSAIARATIMGPMVNHHIGSLPNVLVKLSRAAYSPGKGGIDC